MTTKETRVAIIGLGYTGLPLAIAFVEAGLGVEAIDSSAARVAELNAGFPRRSTTSPMNVWARP